MILSDDKITQITHIVLRGLLKKGLIVPKEEESVIRKEIRRTIMAEMKKCEDIDVLVRKKLQSYNRKPIEGSPEWDILYRKFFEEEETKRGLR